MEECKSYLQVAKKFPKICRIYSFVDLVMHKHVRKVHDKETHTHYLGKEIQNEMIKLLSDAVQNKILLAVHNAK